MLTRARGPLYAVKVRALQIVIAAEKAGTPISATELRDQLGADITGPDWKAIRSHVEKSGGKLRRIIPLPWTDAQRAEVVSLYLAGNSMRQIGALYGRPDHAVEEVIRRARKDGQTIPKRQGAQPARGVKLREDQIADALAARLEKPATQAGSGGGGDVVSPPASPPPVLCRVALSLMQRGVPRERAIAQARVHRARQAEQVAARSARAVVSGQVSQVAHRPETMPEANR